MRPTVRTSWRVPLTAALVAVLAATACNKHSNSPSPPPCSYALTATTMAFDASGGSGTVGVQTGANCAWTAQAGANWIAITGAASGSGPATVAFTVAANADVASRNGSLTVANQQVAIRQEGRQANCTFEIAPTTAGFSKDGGTGRFELTTGDTCSWSTSTSVSWITVTSDRQGTGSAPIDYAVARNADSTPRTGTIRVGGQIFTVQQSGDAGVCQYSVSPVQFAPCMPSTELTSEVVTQAACPWTAVSGTSWIAILSPPSNTGSGTVRFRVTDNYDAPRNGVVMLRWPTPTAGQNLQVAQAGCTYATSPTSFNFAVGGGAGTFSVIQQSIPILCGGALQDACVWTARSNVSWITINTAMPQTGDDPVSFTVAANTTGATRTGTVTVRQATVTVTQAGS